MIHRPERERGGCLQPESVAVSAWRRVEAVFSYSDNRERHQLRLVITGDRKKRKGDRCVH